MTIQKIIILIARGIGKMKTGKKELRWYAEGEGKPPIKIYGNDQRRMLMALAIIQNVGRTQRGMHYVDPRDKKPLKLTISG
jgi:hypothetical protein